MACLVLGGLAASPGVRRLPTDIILGRAARFAFQSSSLLGILAGGWRATSKTLEDARHGQPSLDPDGVRRCRCIAEVSALLGTSAPARPNRARRLRAAGRSLSGPRRPLRTIGAIVLHGRLAATASYAKRVGPRSRFSPASAPGLTQPSRPVQRGFESGTRVPESMHLSGHYSNHSSGRSRCISGRCSGADRARPTGARGSWAASSRQRGGPEGRDRRFGAGWSPDGRGGGPHDGRRAPRISRLAGFGQ